MKWFEKNIVPKLLLSLILGCVGFFMDFQALKAKVVRIKTETQLNYTHIKESLNEIKSDIKEIKRRSP